ncbi:MAG: hypothetical protein LBC37_08720 [Zoogloeaceae bacterium]|jgi:hypothetical protein|nr:hypothetical protein [Zoogloeaceae bacterium]
MTIFLSGLQNGYAAGAGRSASALAPVRQITTQAAPSPVSTAASTQVNIGLYGRTMVLTRLPGAADAFSGDTRAADAEEASSSEPENTPETREVFDAAILRASATIHLLQLQQQSGNSRMSPEALAQRQEAILRGEDPDGGRFGKYQARLDPYMVTFFSINDKKIIGEAYEMATKEEDLARIDKLVMELGALRIRQHLNGELIRSVRTEKVNPDDVPYEPDVAHLPLLGEMKRLAVGVKK